MAATVYEIVDYWSKIEDESGLAIDWAEAHERCWRCGYRAKLERCHIVPDALGGAATPDNLVLLCGRCHREAPNHENPIYMWRWLRTTSVPLYDTYWSIRGFEEFQAMFGRQPLDWMSSPVGTEPELVQEFTLEMQSELGRVVRHFGEGRLNPSTIACILAEIEKTLASRHGVALETLPVTRQRRGTMNA